MGRESLDFDELARIRNEYLNEIEDDTPELISSELGAVMIGYEERLISKGLLKLNQKKAFSSHTGPVSIESRDERWMH